MNLREGPAPCSNERAARGPGRAALQPETDREPRFQRCSIDCREEWVVLDALNHVKGGPDAELPLVCHMAVCSSCGAMINGKPAAAERSARLPGRHPRRALAHLRSGVVTVPDDFIAKLTRVKPSSWRTERRRRAANTCNAGAAQALQAVHAVHQLHAAAAACPEYALIPSHRPSGARWRTAGTRIRATAGAPRARRRSRRPKACGIARSSAPAPRCARSTWIRRRRSSR
jgi:succinate dehydrogenase/fumarate reductase-like Fe-S protein